MPAHAREAPHRGHASRITPVAQPEMRTAPFRVLVVDDDPNIRSLLVAILRDEGLLVVTASDGDAALRIMHVEPPDIVILDLQMPGMDGRSCFQAMRERGIPAPVLILSARGARRARTELGADAALDKPFDPQEVVDQVMRLLQP